MSSHRQFVLVGLSTLVLLPFTAHAQLGKLKKLGEQAARDAVARKVGVESPAGTTTGGADATSARSSMKLEITPERIGVVLAALAPQVERARRLQTERDAERAVQTKRTAFETCLKQASERVTAFDPSNMDRASKYNEQLAVMMQRSATLNQQPARKRDALFLTDSMSVLALQAQAVIVGASCGAPPYRTAASIDAELARSRVTEVSEAMESGNGTKWTVPEDKRGGLTTAQFGLLRERIALWTLLETGDLQPNGATFSDGERAALGARSGDLKALAPLFLDGSLTWSRWYDLTNW